MLNRKAIQARFDALEAYWDVVDAHGRCDDHSAWAAFKEHGPADLTTALDLVDEQQERLEAQLRSPDPDVLVEKILAGLQGANAAQLVAFNEAMLTAARHVLGQPQPVEAVPMIAALKRAYLGGYVHDGDEAQLEAFQHGMATAARHILSDSGGVR